MYIPDGTEVVTEEQQDTPQSLIVKTIYRNRETGEIVRQDVDVRVKSEGLSFRAIAGEL